MLDQALERFTTTLALPLHDAAWTVAIRQQLATLTDAVARESSLASEAWLQGRAATLDRQRRQLLGRLMALGPLVLGHPGTELALRELRRVATDLDHYRPRLHDFVYDGGAMEVGGEE